MTSGPSDGALVGLGVTIGLTVLGTLFIALRFWSRFITRFGLWLDDWLALATLAVMYWALIISALATYAGALGKPIGEALAEDDTSVTTLMRLLFMLEWAYLVASPLMKLAVLAYYWRIFPGRSIRRGIWVITAACGVWFVGVLLGTMLQCVPISRFWNVTGPGYCRWPISLWYVVTAIPNIIIDLATVVLPLYEVWHLKLSFWKRVGVCAIFTVGGLVVIASITRLAFLVQFYITGLDNMTEDLLLPWFSTSVEVGVAIIGFCLPCLMPLYRKIRYGGTDSKTRAHAACEHETFSKSRANATTSNSKSIPGMPARRSSRKPPSNVDVGGPFRRLSTTNSSRDEEFGPTSPLYHAKAAGGCPGPSRVKVDKDGGGIALEGINVVREIKIERSETNWRHSNSSGSEPPRAEFTGSSVTAG